MNNRDLASALRRAAAAHGENEKRIGHRGENWPDWYAAYGVGKERRKAAGIGDYDLSITRLTINAPIREGGNSILVLYAGL